MYSQASLVTFIFITLKSNGIRVLCDADFHFSSCFKLININEAHGSARGL